MNMGYHQPDHAIHILTSLPEMVALIEQFGLIDALCDSCAFGLVSKDNQPLLKPWRSVTSSKRLAANLSAYRGQHARGFRHAPVEGSESRKSAFHPEPMARVIIVSLFPFAQTFVAPALPCRPSMPQAHRDNDAHPLKPIDVLLFETAVKEVEVQGLVHRLLDRKKWIGQASAIECVRGEKDGLVNAGTWIESQIQSKADVLSWSRRTSNSVHFGSLMVIVSVKGAELSPDSWKLKARIVFRGENIRDEGGMSAVFDELYSGSPSSLEGLNTTIAFGLLDSH